MVNYSCDKCYKTFTQKSHYTKHQKRKNMCENNADKINVLIDKAVEDKLNTILPDITLINKDKIEINNTTTPTTILSNQMDYSTKTRKELIVLCKEKKIKGYSGKKKGDIVKLLMDSQPKNEIIVSPPKVEDKKKEETINISSDDYVYQTMLTCIGNKRKLVKNIREIVEEIRLLLNKDKLNIVDGFAGSSVVSRELSYTANTIYTNDLEYYAYLMAYCYLVSPTEEQKRRIETHINDMNNIAKNGPFIEGIISKLYAPKDTKNIKEGERCFYTRENALIIDTLRKYIEEKIEVDIKIYCLVPLLNKASINTNTAGVFKGFYKNGNIGCFGGKGQHALSRITKPIQLDIPIWSNSTFTAYPSNKDVNTLVSELPNDIDVMYLDPPYNQHPYGSNYFMLNVIAKNEEPVEISKVSGIPTNWNKSTYNKHESAVSSMKHLMNTGVEKSKYLLISYNNEGIITDDDWKTLFEPYNVKKYEIRYDTFKGCRNLKNRSNKVLEIMYLVSKKA
jgi:adenine-specific DNA-methyltransferase